MRVGQVLMFEKHVTNMRAFSRDALGLVTSHASRPSEVIRLDACRDPEGNVFRIMSR